MTGGCVVRVERGIDRKIEEEEEEKEGGKAPKNQPTKRKTIIQHADIVEQKRTVRKVGMEINEG